MTSMYSVVVLQKPRDVPAKTMVEPVEQNHGDVNWATVELSDIEILPRILEQQFGDFTGEKVLVSGFLVSYVLKSGKGRNSQVQLARHRQYTSLFVAVKMIDRCSASLFKKTSQHILGEKAVLNMIEHPNCAKLLKTLKDESYLYFVFEYLPGGDLSRHLEVGGALPYETARFYICEIVHALIYLHSKNILHRDIKPKNIVLDADGHCVIVDFGFAFLIAPPSDRALSWCGTVHYFAPERLSRESGWCSKASEWWMIGCLAFEFMTGRPPFYDSNPEVLASQIFNSDPDLTLVSDSDARDFIGQLLIKNHELRLQSDESVSCHPFIARNCCSGNTPPAFNKFLGYFPCDNINAQNESTSKDEFFGF